MPPTEHAHLFGLSPNGSFVHAKEQEVQRSATLEYFVSRLRNKSRSKYLLL
jgi:hypothetical protein